MSCSFVVLPSHGPKGFVRTIPLKLVRATANQLFDGDPVEAICLSPRARSTLFESCCRNAIRPLSPDAWHWSITQIVEHCLPACHGGFAKFSLECLGNVAVATHPLSHTVSFPPMSPTRTAHSKFKKTLQGLRPEPRAQLAYYVISIETQDVNMGIRKRSILTAFAIMLIAAAPAWSQSLLKTLDPDNDGTVDLGEAFTRPYDAECVLLKPADGMCLLDLGCGSGAAADYLASRCSLEILCVTNSRAQADICQLKFEKFEGRVRVIVADFDDLDLPAESFDAIYALESIGYTKDLEAWLAPCWQSLKPGGHLLIRSPGSLDQCH